MLASVADALLLQQKWNYFTGGFLTTQFTSTWFEVAAFAVGSVAADLALLGVGVVAAVWALRPVPLSCRLRSGLVLCAVLVPVAVADVVSYEIASYFGAGFDLGMMFDLVSRRPLELLAVSMGHVSTAVMAGAAATLAVIVALWLRHRAPWVPRVDQSSTARHLWAPALATLVAGSVLAVSLRLSSDTLSAGLGRKPTAALISLAANAVTDVDRDGFGMLQRVADPDPLDARIFPFALDVPGNGIDEDGVAGDLPADAPQYAETSGPSPTWARKPNVVLILLEGVRADALGATVQGTPVTPVLDSIASRGVRLTHAYSHNGYTVQSRWHSLSGSLADLRGHTSLVDDFKANGYETAYFSAQDDSFGGPEFDVGYSLSEVAYDARQDIAKRYTRFATPGSLAVSADVLLSRIQGFLESRSGDRPLFLYANFHDTHFPYHHAAMRLLLPVSPLPEAQIAPGHADALRAGYLNAVANVDQSIGTLMEVATRSLGGTPAVVVISDHGESLFDDGRLGHGFEINDQQLRIPVVAAGLPFEFEEPFGQADLRDIIRAALSAPTAAAAPRVTLHPTRQVFHYLGLLDRPGQIALRSATELIAYDFRLRRVRVAPAQDWVEPAGLPPEHAARFRALIHRWESMVGARSHASSDPPSAPR